MNKKKIISILTLLVVIIGATITFVSSESEPTIKIVSDSTAVKDSTVKIINDSNKVVVPDSVVVDSLKK